MIRFFKRIILFWRGFFLLRKIKRYQGLYHGMTGPEAEFFQHKQREARKKHQKLFEDYANSKRHMTRQENKEFTQWKIKNEID